MNEAEEKLLGHNYIREPYLIMTDSCSSICSSSMFDDPV